MSSKENKIETFNLELLIQQDAAGKIESGNIYYDPGTKHKPHLDLHVNMTDGTEHSYRLYNPPSAPIFEMRPRENIIFPPLPPSHNQF